MRGERLIQIIDMAAEHSHGPAINSLVSLLGSASAIFVALVRDADPVGAFAIARRQTGPFTDKQIALLQNFAAQAVIAMENARLLGELRQRTGDLETSLEYQTATSDVLKVISRSTFDRQRVLETLVSTAARLCGAEIAVIAQRNGELLSLLANFGFPPEFEAFFREHPQRVGRGTVAGRAVLEQETVHIADVTADPEYTFSEATELGGARTVLGVPLQREGELIGVIVLSRRQVKPFTERQIEL